VAGGGYWDGFRLRDLLRRIPQSQGLSESVFTLHSGGPQKPIRPVARRLGAEPPSSGAPPGVCIPAKRRGTLFRNGASLSIFFSSTSALFSMQRRGCPFRLLPIGEKACIQPPTNSCFVNNVTAPVELPSLVTSSKQGSALRETTSPKAASRGARFGRGRGGHDRSRALTKRRLP
jgi:hypothetical protein